MYSVFYKDSDNGETEFKFQTILLNKPDDKFVKNGLESMGWKKEDTKIFFYNDSIKFKNFMKWMESPNPKERIFVEANGLMKKQRIVKEPILLSGTVPFDCDSSLDFYTQQEIDDYNACMAIYNQWLEDNTVDGVLDENATPPDYGEIEWPSFKEAENFIETNGVYEDLDTLAGVEVDIAQKISEEVQ